MCRKGKDTLISDDKKNHILIVHKGSFFTFEVLNEDGEA